MVTVIRGARFDRDPLLLARASAQAAASDSVGGLDEPIEDGPSAEDDTAAALETLQAPHDEAVRAGYKNGYDEGLRQGRKDGEHRFLEAEATRAMEHEAPVSALGAILESARTALTRAIDESEDVLVEIAFESVSKILGAALAQQAGVLAVIQQVMQHARERERMVVRVSPKDMTMIEAHRHLLHAATQASSIELVADSRVTLGGCLLETTGGTLDGRLETQMQTLCEVLLRTRNGVEP